MVTFYEIGDWIIILYLQNPWTAFAGFAHELVWLQRMAFRQKCLFVLEMKAPSERVGVKSDRRRLHPQIAWYRSYIRRDGSPKAGYVLVTQI